MIGQSEQQAAQKSKRALLLAAALEARRRDVKELVGGHPSGAFASDCERIADRVGESRGPIAPPVAGQWRGSRLQFEEFLTAAAADAIPEFEAAGAPTMPVSLPIRKSAVGTAMEAVQARYRCPLNVLLETEDAFFEESLRYLMVIDRAQHVDEVRDRFRWVLLNLVALRCRTIPDLRALDVLNFYWEALPRPWPASRLVWAFLGNYDGALEIEQ